MYIVQLQSTQDIDTIYTNQKRYGVNKDYIYQGIFSGLDDWNIIILRTSNISDDANNNIVFAPTLNRDEAKISDRILR